MNKADSIFEHADRKRRLKEAKHICDNYIGEKLRVKRYPKRRPTFFRQMKVNLDHYAETGIVDYDEELAKQLDPDDAFFLQGYVEDMFHVWIVEHVIASARSEVTRQIAEDTIFRGKKCSDLEAKYGLKTRAIQARRRTIFEQIAEMIP